MKQVCVAWLLLLCVTGAAGACDPACSSPEVCDTDNNCKKGAGADCDPDTDTCVAHSLCSGTTDSETCVCDATAFVSEAGLCKAKPGQTCDDSAKFCTAKHTCDDGKCKANIGQNCDEGATTPVNCLADHTCDTTCKGDAGQSCDLTADPQEQCVDTATCEGGTCKANAGENCDGTTVTCIAGHTCDGGKCKANAGETCDGTTVTCVAGHTCESTKCKANIGQDCDTTAATPVNCLADHTCDTTCKANAGQSCDLTASPPEQCVGTAACDGGTCKKKVNESCTVSDDCAGSNVECSTSKLCTCTAGKSANADKSDCSGVSGLAGSVILLIAALVTSRFLCTTTSSTVRGLMGTA